MTRPNALWALLILATTHGGCATSYFVDSKGILGGLAGRAWRSVVHLEPVTAAPVNVDSDGRTHLSFDAASSGDRIILAATLFDSTSGVYRLYSRAYDLEVGLAASGVSANFVDLATSAEAGESLGAIGLVGSRTGKGVTASAFQTAGAAAQRAVCRFTGTDWGDPQFDAAGPVVSIPADALLQGGPLAASVLDQLGEVYTAFVETASDLLTLESHSVGGAAAVQFAELSESSVGVADRQVSLAFDGVDQVCALWQNTAVATTVNFHCVSSLTGTVGAATALSLGSEGWGHAIAGRGAILVAVYFAQDSAGTMQVYAHLTDDGTFSGTPEAVSEEMDSDFEVLGDLSEGGAPQVVALSSNTFMVAWAAASATEAGIFYSIYTVDEDEWSTPELIDQAITYSTLTPIDSFHLFTDGDSGAGVAIRYFSNAGATRDESTRKMLLGRYHSSVGWLALVQKGEGCTPASAAEVAGCSHRPTGAILDSGAAVVLFQDQDTDGNYRWSGVEFR